MNKAHQKHPKIKRPALGQFGRNEYAILGTTCGKIQQLSKGIIQALSSDFKLAYVDADHKSADMVDTAADTAMDAGAYLNYTDKIGFHRFDFKTNFDAFQFRGLFNEADMILINGNHFPGRKQLVVIDPVKFESLGKKLDRLTDVQLFLLEEGQTAIPDFLKERLPKWAEIPVLSIKNKQSVHEFFRKEMMQNIPPVYGLVLAGGKSTRMGKDKGLISYHGKAQREYMAEMLDELCSKTFLSFRADQNPDAKTDFPILKDRFEGLGPFGAILSAFREEPEAAWLVVACDLPMLDKATLNRLLTERDSSQFATCYRSPVNAFPEPLVALWEPKAYPVALQFLAQGYSCPRKVLINSPVKELEVSDGSKLLNVNTPEDMKSMKE